MPYPGKQRYIFISFQTDFYVIFQLGTNPLHLAAQGNHVEICKILLRSGISANARTKVDRTPLHMAAYEGHLEIVELLLKDKAEIDETDLVSSIKISIHIYIYI